MDMIREIRAVQTKVIADANAAFEELIQKVMAEQGNTGVRDTSNNNSANFESIFSLMENPANFKGKKPTGVIFGENDRVDVPTWKKLTEEIMSRCNSDSEKHVELMNLRGRLAGRDRQFLSKEKDRMRSPLKIDENLYMETHYDTETLLRILTTRILDAVGYDYSNILVAIRNS